MKRLFIVFVSAVACLAAALQLHAADRKMVRVFNTITQQPDSFPRVTIHDIQYVRPESLHVADSLQLTQSNSWGIQKSPYFGDTVVVVAHVLVPAKQITYTNHGWTYLI